jgi:hypothetical protein
MEAIQKRKTILDILQEIEDELKKDPDTIPEHVFQAIEGLCKIAYGFRHRGQKDGWIAPLGYLTPAEGRMVESVLNDSMSQTGGGPEDDKEFTSEFNKFQKILDGLGTQWREIMNSLGIIATNTIESLVPKDTPSLATIRTEKPAQQTASGIIFMFLSGLVEGLRIWVAYSLIDSSTYRVLLSFSQGLLDVLRGNVRQAILSSIGLFGKNGYYISILTRFILNIIETITPDLRSQMEFDIYKNIKSLSAAGLLWMYYTFAPQNLKYNINLIFQEIQEIAKKEEISLGPLTTELQKSAKDQKVELPKIPLENTPSYDDLQILGTLLKQPEIVCLPSFQKLLAPMRSVFTLRMILDLFDIPTGQIEIEDLCSRKGTQTRRKSEQKGGRRKRTRRIEQKV